jgi:hypothetical protein
MWRVPEGCPEGFAQHPSGEMMAPFGHHLNIGYLIGGIGGFFRVLGRPSTH